MYLMAPSVSNLMNTWSKCTQNMTTKAHEERKSMNKNCLTKPENKKWKMFINGAH